MRCRKAVRKGEKRCIEEVKKEEIDGVKRSVGEK